MAVEKLSATNRAFPLQWRHTICTNSNHEHAIPYRFYLGDNVARHLIDHFHHVGAAVGPIRT